MLENLESHYDCSQAGEDLHQLQEELNAIRNEGGGDPDTAERMHRLENQIHFIKNKCDIHP
ncbi:hypothetical protein LJK88_31030 [Paenibacillus sp. P26]|nr:hypothetical protein LJK88_31030 [Paenibacillus sp. P26]UUZ94332.1 hypothetical protein LJK87_07030 [Paenibacillus sp. P25]